MISDDDVHYIEHVWTDSELEALCDYFHSQVTIKTCLLSVQIDPNTENMYQ